MKEERWRQNPRCAANIVAGEAAVVGDGTGELHMLDEVATRIWELLGDDGSTLDALVSALTEEFDAPAGEIREDTRSFLDQSVQTGIVLHESI